MAGVPSQREGTGRDKRRKRNGRGSLTAGRNGPGGRQRDVSEVGSGVRAGRCFGSGTGSGMNSAGSAWSFCCLSRAMVGLRAAGDSRLGRWGSSAQRGVRVLSAGRNTGSGTDSVDAVKAVGSALMFCPGSEKERNFSSTGSIS
jgi:hypothetical protein